MARKNISWKTKGMNRDMSVSAFNPEFAFENINVRLATNEGNTMMSWVNERGTKELSLNIDTKPWLENKKEDEDNDSYENEIKGTPIGMAVINHQLVLFTTGVEESNPNHDRIYVLWKSKNDSYDLEGKLMCTLSMGFDVKYPIETLVSYESENIQKVYWTDNLNQPRVVNIASSMDYKMADACNQMFDFTPELQLREKVKVTKNFGAGEFPPGVIQYAFTYYYKYGQETSIFYTTPLYYISYVDRGGKPDDKISNNFKITISNIDQQGFFDYVRIYSILRTSIDATPVVKRVADLAIPNAYKTVAASKAKKHAKQSSSGSNFDDFGKTMEVSYFAKFRQIAEINDELYVEGAVCYDKYLFQAYIGGKYIDVIDLETNQRLATLVTDISLDRNSYHGNVLSFGKELAEGSDFPYLYYSCESNASPEILVFKIVHTGNSWTGNLVQQIYLPTCKGGISQGNSGQTSSSFAHYYQNGCVDADNNCIWVSGYTMDSYYQYTDSYADNSLVYRKYPLPSPTENSKVYFSYRDVERSFLLPFKKGTQGMVIRKGKLYQCFGYDVNDTYDEYLDCIDLGSGSIVKSYNFPKEQLSTLGKELESPYIYKDNLYLSATGHNERYYTLWSISFTEGGGGVVVPPVEDDGESLSFVDDGRQGDIIDPTELLYKNSEKIKVKDFEQKDGTLFLGNFSTDDSLLDIKEKLLEYTEVSAKSPLIPSQSKIVTTILNERSYPSTSLKPFAYTNTLTSGSDTDSMGNSGFKGNEYYRLGVQFQSNTGKWSEPFWIGDMQQDKYPEHAGYNPNTLEDHFDVPGFEFTLSSDIINTLVEKGYKNARPLFVVPTWSDRHVLCQGVGCPTMYRKINRYADAKASSSNSNDWEGNQLGTLYAQSSWLFRCPVNTGKSSDMAAWGSGDAENGGGKVTYTGKLDSQYDQEYAGNDTLIDSKKDKDYLLEMSPWLRATEIMGKYDDGHAFYIDLRTATIHSPELIFTEDFNSIDLKGCSMRLVGNVPLMQTYGDIDIQVSTPALGSDAAGFVHKSVITDGAAALISGLYFNDYLVDDTDSTPSYGSYNTKGHPPVDWPVYMWHKNGSLNNDVKRDNRSAELLKKKISNYRLGGDTNYFTDNADTKYSEYFVEDMQLFNSDVLSLVKVNGYPYMGNIETMLTPTASSAFYFVGDPINREKVDTDFNSDAYFKLALEKDTESDSDGYLWQFKYDKTVKWTDSKMWKWFKMTDAIGDKVKGLCNWRESIPMKYKSTPHIVVKLQETRPDGDEGAGGSKNTWNTIYSARSGLNYTKNDRLPIVEIYRDYNKNTFFGGTSDDAMKANTWIPCGPVVPIEHDKDAVVQYLWGDTYFQRFECLKTYPFTPEDKNQVVEIASFMCESRVNIDGRYDKNRGQTSNLNMTPQNFNLYNPVYSQLNNFFSYKILDEDAYKNTDYPNTITWTKTKQSGADIDLWTNITLANTLELDGDKGAINKLVRLNNQLLAFQDSGVSQILYNENTQISTTEGVPIEIANSDKVQGKRYYSDTIGCSDKWSVVTTPAGIYFIDSNDKSIYLFNGQMNNLSTVGGFNSWAKQNIPSASMEWAPKADNFNNFVAYYDKLNQDVLFIDKETALAFSEKFNCFTSFYDYGGIPYFCNLDDMGIWINSDGRLWKHQAGEYCNFFGSNKPFSMTLVGNQEPQVDKIFTNLEFRSCVEDEGDYDEDKDKITPSLPFDTIEVWDEYQHGILALTQRSSGEKFNHSHVKGQVFLNRKFRIWRCDIPRDNAPVSDDEGNMGIKRFKARPLDRIRNPWAYVKLQKNAAGTDKYLGKTEVHDIMLSYFG